ncbi:aminotransferase [Sphingomonas sp. Root710]|uniref:pyridoxal phosphate-dependent aminotransferase n=1 Tax=Sphingomonas sp. Root710 TaxID=1736594 RepID=UPI0006FCE0B7|nr:pyridoxal phosphate-dependent aminotransferase [Sphingomonas sp. Root710]KRB85502.1 aminotransferase [Sphingomonas sp. Root710]
MRFSERAASIAPFYAMEFGKHAAALEADGARVIRLNLGEPDFGAPPAVLEAARHGADGRQLPYTAALGTPDLRKAIAGFYAQTHGVNISPSRIVVTAGASAALLLVTATLVDPGDEVIVGDPSYPCNRQFLASFGANVKLVATDAASRFQLGIDALKANWTPETRGLMIATPSNPTGTSVLQSELMQMCDWARSHDAWRIVDEIYLNLGDPDRDGRPPQTVLAFDDDAIVINSFSKYFGMTGWRLGWCVVPDALVPVVERMAQNFYICPPTLSQIAALACFTPESLKICEERRSEFSRRRTLILDGLKRIGLHVPVAPDGAFYVYFDVSSTGLSSWDFCMRALHEAHVALTPGKDFGPSGADRYVRLSYAASSDDLVEAVDRLGDFLAKLPRHNPSK